MYCDLTLLVCFDAATAKQARSGLTDSMQKTQISVFHFLGMLKRVSLVSLQLA